MPQRKPGEDRHIERTRYLRSDCSYKESSFMQATQQQVPSGHELKGRGSRYTSRHQTLIQSKRHGLHNGIRMVLHRCATTGAVPASSKTKSANHEMKPQSQTTSSWIFFNAEMVPKIIRIMARVHSRPDKLFRRPGHFSRHSKDCAKGHCLAHGATRTYYNKLQVVPHDFRTCRSHIKQISILCPRRQAWSPSN